MVLVRIRDYRVQGVITKDFTLGMITLHTYFVWIDARIQTQEGDKLHSILKELEQQWQADQ